MLRSARHSKIMEIIEEKEIETQEELGQELARQNYAVTQATVSRDIKELHLFKVKGTQKRFRYTSILENESGLSDKMRVLFQACVVSIRPVGNLIVIKTLNGNATNAGAVIDKLNYWEVVGTVAGDDTLLLICENIEHVQSVVNRLNAIVKG
ncbi:MAG: arginine repressor [Clostridia bacterium]|nr:arginine repressor [Clostridia bacterium]MDE6676794.1 arginine repressor [Clostridia bacterium]